MTHCDKRTEKQYLEDVERIAKHNGLKGSGEYIIGDEIGFTWNGCDVCGDPCGGNKHEVNALIEDEQTGKLEPIDIGEACADCTIYIANGDLSGHDFAEEEEKEDNCKWCGETHCDCQERIDCPKAGKIGHLMCGTHSCGCPKYAYPNEDVRIHSCSTKENNE